MRREAVIKPRNPPAWLKKRARIEITGLQVRQHAVTLDLAWRGVAAFWRGWWMIDLVLGEAPACGYVTVRANGAAGSGRVVDVPVPIASTRSSKRLFHAPWRIRSLSVEPTPDRQAYDVLRLRLAPVLPAFAVDRMYALLASGSRDLRGRPLRDLDRLLPAADRQPGQSVGQLLYREYTAAIDAALAGEHRLYEHWIRFVEPRQFVDPLPDSDRGLRISIVMPVHDPEPAHLRQAIESVLDQTYPNWELCIADDASVRPEVRPLIADYCANDPRIKTCFLQRHGHISAASNHALALASGDFVTFLDHDDVLAPQALNEIATALLDNPSLDIVYSDEDFLNAAGNRCTPHFKSDWNPYLLYSHNYVTHLCAYRHALVQRVGGLRGGVEGAQDYDLLLRCSALVPSHCIAHIPKILYHWRMSEASTATDAGRKGYTHAAGKKALAAFFDASDTPVDIQSAGADNFYRVNFRHGGADPLVSVIVPTRDRVDLLERCVDGLLHRTEYANLELLIVDNGSVEPSTRDYLDRLVSSGVARVMPFDRPFNYAQICNSAVEQAHGELVAFVNNDVDVIGRDWLDEMVMLARRPDVGCVGAKLYYADGTVQHAGVILGLGGYAAHSHRCAPGDDGGYFQRLKVRQNVSAVTAACLVVRRQVYDEVGGMDERLAVAYNDVDFCLKVLKAGYLNVFTPFAELYHFESKTRGYEDTPEKQARFQREKDYLRSKWGGRVNCDPYYNPNLTHAREDFSIGL